VVANLRQRKSLSHQTTTIATKGRIQWTMTDGPRSYIIVTPSFSAQP
jgi:hypothetical protein